MLSLCPPSSGRFEDPWADEETVLGHPEKDVLTYLETCASALGLALDLEAKISALRALRATALGDGDGGIAASTECSTTGSASSSTMGEFGGEGVRNKPATISSAKDIYAAVTTALSRALVHCKRFEVRGGKPYGQRQVWSTTRSSWYILGRKKEVVTPAFRMLSIRVSMTLPFFDVLVDSVNQSSGATLEKSI